MHDSTIPNTDFNLVPKSRHAHNVLPRNLQEPPSIEGARWIPLTKGMFALVDETDFEPVSKWFWSTLTRKGYFPYAFRRETNKTVYLHRFIMNAATGTDVDHINGDGMDCRKANLRVCTHGQNQRNYRKCTKATSSRFKGVCWDKSRGLWAARIKHLRKVINLGRFENEDDAARAYDRAARELFGEFAHPNFPDGVPSVGLTEAVPA